MVARKGARAEGVVVMATRAVIAGSSKHWEGSKTSPPESDLTSPV